MSEALDQRDRLVGLLLGTAVGDALGLPAEGLSPVRIRRRWNGAWHMRLVFGRGMVSDDTEHAFFVAQSLLVSPKDATAFRKSLAARLRWWFLALPAGVGLATARACLRLWLGISPERSGVNSAGNGPAMRSAVLGAFFSDDERRRREFVAASTRLTHTDPRAEIAALAVAEAVAWAANAPTDSSAFLKRLPACGTDGEWLRICHRLGEGLAAHETVKEFACSLGLGNGVSGYAFHTVPVAIYAWLRHPGDFRQALTSALDCGGDTDTVGAIVGALTGGDVGEANIPKEWIEALWEWPRTANTLRKLANRLAQQQDQPEPLQPVRYFWLGVLPRNVVFLLVVLIHGLRRLFPPY
ncbi:MAG: ADP-ribosylglycohydrolase family protein [Verrucomicrobia bacterium]|nr:ADP-ribosylglycohydrolase family protein [Verrucomicrobiota bacterium]